MELSRALFKPRRRLDNKTYFLRLVREGIDRWDSLFIRPANMIAEKLGVRIKEKIADASYKKIYLANPGDVAILDNWKLLHCRSRIASSALNRKLERVYLEEIYH